jgi:hypothetical protein
MAAAFASSLPFFCALLLKVDNNNPAIKKCFIEIDCGLNKLNL